MSNNKIDPVTISSQISSLGMFMVSNTDGTIIDTSESALIFFDLTRDEIVNRYTLDDFFSIPSSIKDLISSDEDTIERDGEHIIAGIVRNPKDGVEFPSEIYLRRLQIGDQDSLLTIFNHRKGGSRDSQAENALDEVYRERTEGIRDILYSARQDGTITFISPQVSRYGYNPQDFISRKLIDFIHEEDKERFLAEFQASFWSEGSNLNEFRIYDSKGNIYFFEDNHGSWTNITGEIFEVSGVLRDISNRKLSEKGSQLMEKRLDLLSSITRHEILNQLYILHGSNAILQEYMSDPTILKLLERQEQAIKNIHKQIEITRLYQERGSSDPKWQNVEEIIMDVAPGHIQNRISLSENLIGLDIYADPLLNNAFYNLLDNALKHGKTVSRITFDIHTTQSGIVIILEDDGVGIPNIEKEGIFSRGVGRNNGLGLFLVRNILEITGISIKETGEPGKGARFEMHIPEGGYRFR